MATKLVISNVTRKDIDNFTAQPSHAVVLIGATGSGKSVLATEMASHLLDITAEQFSTHPYVRILKPEGTSISIEAVRELQHFLLLKIPGTKRIARIVVIEDAHMLTHEAQNALLKTLEEPPEDTVLLLTASEKHALLPTVLSRSRLINVITPPSSEIEAYFLAQGHETKQVAQAAMMAGGLAGLMQALLQEDTEHPLFLAANDARKLLQTSAFERLCMVDNLSKQKVHGQNTVHMLEQMARLALARGSGSVAAQKRWQQIMQSAYTASEQLRRNAQPKLVLTTLMLNL